MPSRPGSVTSKVTVAEVDGVVAAGPSVIVTIGAPVFTAQLRLAVLVLPSGSVAVSTTVWLPSVSPVAPRRRTNSVK